MKEIIELLSKNKYKYRYTFQSYLNKLKHLYSPEDIEQEVLLKLFIKHNDGNIDMGNIENYLFITYRNCVINAFNKLSNTKYTITDEMLLKLKYEVSEPSYDENLLGKVKNTITNDEYKLLYEYYDKYYHNKEVPIRKSLECKIYRIRKKIKTNLHF